MTVADGMVAGLLLVVWLFGRFCCLCLGLLCISCSFFVCYLGSGEKVNESDMNGTYVGMYLYMQFTISPGPQEDCYYVPL